MSFLEVSALRVGQWRRLGTRAKPKGAGRSGRLPALGADDRAEVLPGRTLARDHVLFIIVSPRERGWRARPSTRELEFPDPSSRVLDWFE